jgi:starvation-inducible DNA-binding protein
MKTGIKDRKAIASQLYHLLAETYSIYIKTQNFHWNLKGVSFYPLHILFEKQYEELAQALDEIAERIQALGSFVDASFQAFAKASCIESERKALKSKKMVQRLLHDHETLIVCAREMTTLAEHEKDQATLDLLARRLGAHEKMAWMLRSHLG